MIVGKPKRRFIIRVIDLKNNKSMNFSIYDGDKEMTLEKIYEMIKKSAKKLLGEEV